eukprot:GHVU01049756.1.p2 GENE.GHVU01049756.1~~GHVU01049756.1.p2  ORF type:complete len:170 (+),score=20.52 GHVU01049756.1:942-1451(+)
MDEDRTPQFVKVAELDPDSIGVNLILKVVEVRAEAVVRGHLSSEPPRRFVEVLAGDSTASIILHLSDPVHIAACRPGSTIAVRKGRVATSARGGKLQLRVGAFGTLQEAPFDAPFSVNCLANMSEGSFALRNDTDATSLISMMMPEHPQDQHNQKQSRLMDTGNEYKQM